MRLSEQELKELLLLKRKQNSDDIYYKELIKRELVKNNKLIYALHNTELEGMEASNDEYFDNNIRDHYVIPRTQTIPLHYLCYEVSFNKISGMNKVIKKGQVIMYILCDTKDIRDEFTGVARHDLIASIIINEFNWSNVFGNQFMLVQDKAGVTDGEYCLRTLVFEGNVTNSLANNPKVFGSVVDEMNSYNNKFNERTD